MRKKRFWAGALWVLVALVVIGLVFAGGAMLGLRMAGLRESGARGLPGPDMFHHFGFWGRPSRFMPGFFGGGLLLRVGLFLLFLLIVGKVLRYAVWGCRPAAGPTAAHWHPHWRGFHAPSPCRGPSDEHDEATAKVRQDAPTGEAAPSDDVEA